MTSAMEGHAALTEPDLFAVPHRMERDGRAEPLAQHPLTAINGPVLTASGAGMVGMGMGDQGPWYGPPGINPGISRAAVEPFRRPFDHV